MNTLNMLKNPRMPARVGFSLVTMIFALSTNAFTAEPAAATAKEAPRNSIYVKILLPKKEPAKDKHPIVESWISEALEKKSGRPELRAVTDWILLPGVGEKPAALWSAVLDGEQWGCPVSGNIEKWTDDDKVNVHLGGWSPAVAEIIGTTLPAEVGSRGMAEVDYGTEQEAFVAILVGPPQVKKEAAAKTADK